MKWLGLVLVLLVVTIGGTAGATAEEPRAEARIVAPSIDPNASCKVCHADVFHNRELISDTDAHSEVDCIECHVGRRFNPHLPPELEGDTAALAEGFRGYLDRSPEVIAGCVECHEDEVAAWRESVHGAGPRNDEGVRRAGCVDCHGSLHAVTPASQGKREIAARCISCHEFDEGEAGPASPFVADTYRETIHGKMLALGNNKAAGCGDCHTGHDIYPADDPRSSVFPANRAETCRKCHKDATDSFTAAISHKPHTIDADFMAGAVALAFSILTVGTIAMLLVHLLLDLYNAGRNVVGRGNNLEHGPADAPVAADDEIQRFDVHIRIQHAIMIVSFVTLALTGWPLKSASVGVSSTFVHLLGGQATLALIHRIAGSMLLGVSVYHLVYLFLRWRRGQLSSEMVPGPKDITDLVGNLLYYMGVRKERPMFGKFTYYEKFDYWAIFWGVPLMGATGLMLWFPELTARLLPGDFLTLAFIAHSDEALLAALAIFLWHFYNQHLRPAVFPMSWVWLTGRIKAEALYDEHRLTYEQMYGSKPPKAPAQEQAWHQHPVWSFVALAVIIVAAILVVGLDVSSVRSQIAQLSAHPEEIEATLAEPETSTIMAAGQEGFDQWATCMDCHNQARWESSKEKFPHKLHFEEEDVDDNCEGCHESVFHERIVTDLTGCLECHDADEVGLEEVE